MLRSAAYSIRTAAEADRFVTTSLTVRLYAPGDMLYASGMRPSYRSAGTTMRDLYSQ